MSDSRDSSRDSGDGADGATARGIYFVHPGDVPRFIPWRRGRTVMGRNPGCAIPLAGRAVSWEHAELCYDGRTAVLRDLKSTNGLLVDGVPVSEALIEDGRVIRLGDFVGVAGIGETDAAAEPLFAEADRLGLHVGPLLRAALQPLAISGGLSRRVVIEGETGTGKRLTARLCHTRESREGAFVAVDCGCPGGDESSTPDELRRRLFGAPDGQPGALHDAADGTLYLANVTALPAVLQDELASVLAGDRGGLPGDFVLVAGSQEPLATALGEGRLQPALYRQLDGVKLRLPALRRRVAEIPSLFRRLFERQERGGRRGRCPLLSTDLVERLCLYDWPCNVREMVLLVERLAALHGDELRLRSAHLPARMMPLDLEKTTSPVTPLGGVDPSSLLDALREAGGNVARAANRLGITRERAYRLIERLGLSATSRAGA
jgi:transcriptional regulator of acetoin/glycerol metabolism